MIAHSDQSSIPARRLAERLPALREREHRLSPGGLTDQERGRETKLCDELIALRERAQSTTVSATDNGPRSARWGDRQDEN
jgi:hypothetical protein